MANRLTIKGQVTVPKEIRDFLQLTSGSSAVEFWIGEDGSVRVRKAEPSRRAANQPRSAARADARGGIDVLRLLSGVCA